jgi:DNA-binding response OmpR family regulator
MQESLGGGGRVRNPGVAAPEKPPAIVVDPHPAVRIVLEYLLSGEGYAVETWAELSEARPGPGPALVLLSPGEEGGLCVFEARDAAETLRALDRVSEVSTESVRRAVGVWSYIPEPFGVSDVLRVVSAVSGFDARRKTSGQTGSATL